MDTSSKRNMSGASVVLYRDYFCLRTATETRKRIKEND